MVLSFIAGLSGANPQMKQFLAVGVLCLSICTSALAQRAHIEFDHHADFSAFHTYGWQPSPEPGQGVWNQRIIEEIDRQLQAKGLTKVDSNPDLWVIYCRSVQKDRTAFPGGEYAVAPNWGAASLDLPPTEATFEEGTLVVELGNPKTKQVVWRGSVTRTLNDNDNKNLKGLDKAVAKLFDGYPPKERK
jgi:hypothetical protein